MLINTTLKTVGSLLGIGSTTPAAFATGRAATPPAAASPPQTAAAVPLPPLGEAARFDISPEGLQAAQQFAGAAASAAAASAGAATEASPAATSALRAPAETVAGAAAARPAAARPAAQVPDDEAAARAWAIRAQAGESSLDMLTRIARLAERPWPTDKAVDTARQADEAAERKTLAIA
ncbi:hypothetical protein SAMN05444389_104187 [Paracoccus solventivorans]|uniref:Uncharacterized protein n=1 Tax=Paracoccus solventivorans TaxID=53463 RepID=A0A1M7GKM9_9RHOB|nr:hypothetical protein [Paracoccus solventivorans]SHM16810.1 hypothetical protein SAMN05444389_104187 [Paracoccus solventivorans]